MALREELVLDIAAANRQLDQLERELSATAASFASDIRGAIDSIDTVSTLNINFEADTAQLTEAIEAAADAANVTVTVTANTEDAASTINSLEAEPVEIPVTADFSDMAVELAAVTRELEAHTVETSVSVDTSDAQQGFAELGRATDAYSAQVDNAEQSVGRLESRIRLLVIATTVGLGALLIKIGTDYNSLVQQVTAGFETLLGSAAAARSMMAELHEFASTSPFPRQVFLEAAQQLLAMGFAATDIVPTLDAIQQAMAAMGRGAADIEAVVEILGRVQSTGQFTAVQFQQLAARGVDAADIIGRQFGKTAGQIRDEIRSGTLDARLAITALTEGMAQDFEGATAKLEDSWMKTQDRIKGAIRDIGALITSGVVDPSGGGAAVEIGNVLATSLRMLEKELGPVIAQINTELLPVFVELAREVIPQFFEVLGAGGTILGGFGSSLTVLVELLKLLANIVSLVPPELLALASTVYGFTKALQLGTAVVGLFQTRIEAMGLAVSKANPWMLAITAAVTALSFVLGSSGKASREFNLEVQKLQTTLDGGAKAGETFAETLRDSFSDPAFAHFWDEMGVSIGQFIDGLRAGGAAYQQFQLDAFQAGDAWQSDFASKLEGIRQATEQAAFLQLEMLVATGELTEAQRDQAVATAEASGTLLVYSDALDAITDGQRRAAAEVDAMRKRWVDALTPLYEYSQGLQQIANEAPEVARVLQMIRQGTIPAEQGFLALAVAMEDAGLSSELMGIAAKNLGVDLTVLQRNIDGAVSGLNRFVDAATSRLPTTSSVFESITAMAGGSAGVPAAMGRATASTDRFTKSLEAAQKALAEALAPATSVDLERAEVGLERALTQQEQAAKRVRDAEAAIRNARFDAADQGVDAAELQIQRELALREAQLGVREAALSEIDARTKLAEVQAKGSEEDAKVIQARERLAEVTEQLAEAQSKAAESGGRAASRSAGAAREQVVTVKMYGDALEAETQRLRTWRTNLEEITQAGFADVAASLAKDGPELAGTVADELARALKAGDTMLAPWLSGKLSAFETEYSETTNFFRTRLGPEMILEAGLIGTGMNDAFSESLSFADSIQLQLELSRSGLDIQGQAIARIAATTGADAARAYAELLDLEGPTVDQAVKAGLALASPEIQLQAKLSAKGVGDSYRQGLIEGLTDRFGDVQRALAELADSMDKEMKKRLGIRSPSTVAAKEIGVPFVDGIIKGIQDQTRAAEAAVTDLAGVMVGAADVHATMKTGRSLGAEVTQNVNVTGSGGGGPLVGELNIYASDPERGLRAASDELESIARRGR